MPRFAMKIEYHGGPFAGWQRQNDVPSVQETVEDALRRLEADHGGIAAAGRTDAGVHALAPQHVFLARNDREPRQHRVWQQLLPRRKS